MAPGNLGAHLRMTCLCWPVVAPCFAQAGKGVFDECVSELTVCVTGWLGG